MIDVKPFEKTADFELIPQILAGDQALYEVIIRRYNPYLFKIGKSYGLSQEDTEDMMQESFISAYFNLDKFENRSSFKTWIVKIMLNHCYHKVKKFSYSKEYATHDIERKNGMPMFTGKTLNTGKAVMNNELKKIIEAAILKIDEEYRMVFTLRELNGLSTRETAEALEISESNVKIRLKRAKAMLRNEIYKSYSPEEIFEFNLIYCNRIVKNVMHFIGSTDQDKKGFTGFNQIRNWFFQLFGQNRI